MSDTGRESRKTRKTPLWRRILLGLASALLLLIVGVGIFAYGQARAYDESMAKVYDVPVVEPALPTDPVAIARGKHLAESMAGCQVSECHGTDLGGGRPIAFGPIGTLSGPNLTTKLREYSNGELARVMQHGIKRDGRSLRFMPSHETNWLPDADVAAVIAYLRTVPAIDRPDGPCDIRVMGKVLDRQDKFVLDVARRIDHTRAAEKPQVPEPNAKYGAFLARSCSGCHGETFGGGPIPGAPPSMATPANLTPHETGLQKWSYADFAKVLETGVRPDGRKLSKDMPYEAFSKADDTERHALWAYFQSIPPKAFGSR